MRVRGLKLVVLCSLSFDVESHPMRVRGLKPLSPYLLDYTSKSHPMRVRGLKHIKRLCSSTPRLVAPHAGAWIETITMLSPKVTIVSRTPCGCVD